MPSTSMLLTSGASSRIALSTASFTVSAEDGHPSQLPFMRSRTTPLRVSASTISTSPPWEPR